MRRGWGIAAALVASLAPAPPASAAGTLIEVGTGELSAGPVLAGERVAWARAAGPGEVDLHLSRLDGSERRSVRVPVRNLATEPAGGSIVTTMEVFFRVRIAWLASGGSTSRIACGRMILRIASRRDMPRL
jgi:hypothetical protein